MADGFHVTGQRETTTASGNTYVPAMEVTFQTDSGVTGKVVLPLSNYSAETVRAAIQSRVQAIDAVNQL